MNADTDDFLRAYDEADDMDKLEALERVSGARAQAAVDRWQHVETDKKTTTTICHDYRMASIAREAELHLVEAKAEAFWVAKNCYHLATISPELIVRIEAIVQRPVYYLIKHGILLHRNLELILDRHEQKKPFFLCTTCRSPKAMHLGHLIPYMVAKYLQDMFAVPLVVQMTHRVRRPAYRRAKDIIACGFDPAKTFIFWNPEFMALGPNFTDNISRLKNSGIYDGVKDSCPAEKANNRINERAVQATPTISSSFPFMFNERMEHKPTCLVVCTTDQKSYIQAAHDAAKHLEFPEPGFISSRFFPSLKGIKSKMTASDPNSAIFLTDTPENIEDKVNKQMFSGCEDSIEEHRTKGGDRKVDLFFLYLRFLMDDDERSKQIHQDYSSGTLPIGEQKKILIEILQASVARHQEQRKKVTIDVVRQFMTPRQLSFRC